MISLIAVSIIAVHATWCMLCRRVSDGIIGKLLYAGTALAALGYLSLPDRSSQDLLNATFALVAVRHFWMKTYWLRILARLQMRKPERAQPTRRH